MKVERPLHIIHRPQLIAIWTAIIDKTTALMLPDFLFDEYEAGALAAIRACHNAGTKPIDDLAVREYLRTNGMPQRWDALIGAMIDQQSQRCYHEIAAAAKERDWKRVKHATDLLEKVRGEADRLHSSSIAASRKAANEHAAELAAKAEAALKAGDSDRGSD